MVDSVISGAVNYGMSVIFAPFDFPDQEDESRDLGSEAARRRND